MDVAPILDTAKGISEFGILIIIAAFSIFGVIFLVRFFVKFFVSSMRKTMESVLESNSEILEQLRQLSAQNQSLQAVLHNMEESTKVESLIEQTQLNSYAIIKKSFGENQLDLVAGATDIIEKNNIKDRETTQKKIKRVVNAAHNKRIIYLNHFKYKGAKLGDYANSQKWIARKEEILTDYIYSDKHDPLLLMRELRAAHEMFEYELKL